MKSRPRCRYNKLGEWRPLIFPGDAKHLIKECQELSDDPDVQGVLLNLSLTGHRCIEFSLRANLELPGEFTGTESNDVLLWKCQPPDDLSNSNVRLYDGLFDFKTGDVGEIEQCLKASTGFSPRCLSRTGPPTTGGTNTAWRWAVTVPIVLFTSLSVFEPTVCGTAGSGRSGLSSDRV
jgi:hypothetical protein